MSEQTKSKKFDVLNTIVISVLIAVLYTMVLVSLFGHLLESSLDLILMVVQYF